VRPLRLGRCVCALVQRQTQQKALAVNLVSMVNEATLRVTFPLLGPELLPLMPTISIVDRDRGRRKRWTKASEIKDT